jgi:hypothetical protein
LNLFLIDTLKKINYNLIVNKKKFTNVLSPKE